MCEALKELMKEEIREARQEAADLLEQSNATIERTIREIKEAGAERERTKAARAKVEQMKEKVAGEKPKPAKKPKKASEPTPAPAPVPKVIRDFRDLRLLGGNMDASTPDPKTPKPKAPKPKSNVTSTAIHQRTVSFSRVLDLRGMRVDEATEALINYMDDALMVGAGEVTILHGTGTGALKQLTRDYLATINSKRRKSGKAPLVYGDGDVNHGGAGLTVVQLG